MMTMERPERLRMARRLMDDFARRTGLSGSGGDMARRYLWTDAFAVQTFLRLAGVLPDPAYTDLAVKLIDAVHTHLGRYHPRDSRQGWISGLPEAEGRQHPTAGGLRIGKALPERGKEEPYNERLEWDRDGQYFHYLTRWVQALLDAERATGHKQYTSWAAELVVAGGKFMYPTDSRTRMYWKMSTDLSRPLVSSMGAHDPLDGLVGALGAAEQAPQKTEALQPVIRGLEDCARGLDWATTDPLGIGGLLLNLARVAELESKRVRLPDSIRPQKLLADSVQGLEAYRRSGQHRHAAEQRLPFRDCGLSLGLRTISAVQLPAGASPNLKQLDRFVPLAGDIENFWSQAHNQEASTWTSHLDINAVTLAASLTADATPA
jgi:hypothetical protein